MDAFELEYDFVHVRTVYSVAPPKKSPVKYIQKVHEV